VFRYAESLSRLEANLDPALFVRVHRSALVNITCVAELQPWFHGDGILLMRDGARVTLSRTHRARLASRLRQPI
jgi:two-component system LytT family response regulator